jgi:hypothetical protein
MNKTLITLLALIIFYNCAPKESPPPNIIFLLTDDQRWDAMGCMGNPDIVTPEMDRLAGEGVFHMLM